MVRGTKQVGVTRLALALTVGILSTAWNRADEPLEKKTPKAAAENKTWKFEDLVGDLPSVSKGRSFANGKQAFDRSLCAICHRIQGFGGDMGPDLGRPATKGPRTSSDILRAILDPSKDVEEKYQTRLIITKQGQEMVGIITEQNDETIQVRTRPVGAETVKNVARKDVESTELLSISMMPDDLVAGLSLEQILDLVAYIESQGNPAGPQFRK